MDFKKEIKKEITKLLKKEVKTEIKLEIPDSKFGDYSFPCFNLAKKLKKNPNEIAKELSKKIKLGKSVEKVEAIGPYLNFFIDKKIIIRNTLKEILSKKDKYGSAKEGKKILIEFPSPNTNKPLHLGHIRNIVIGQSISNVFEFLGNKVTKVNLNNDKGIHICKSMLAYSKFGKNKKPNKKSDHFVGDFYVLYNKKVKENPELEEEAKDLLNEWEEGDKKTKELWKKMNSWALKGFDETYKKFDLKFNKTYNESSIFREGKNIILKGYEKGLFKKDDKGAIYIDLGKELGRKVLLRADGTSVYITQDLSLAELKFRNFNPDLSVYVVGSEQNYHFKVLFKLLELLKSKAAGKNYHLGYGMIYLPHGRMKSREGVIVDADDLIDEMGKLAEKEVKNRYKNLAKKEIEKRAKMISMAALRFFILKFDVTKDFVFNPEESISFEGETGPYVQYAHARICSILKKFKKKISRIDYSLLEEKELVKLLNEFPEIVTRVKESYNPAFLARHLFNLAKEFNDFYRDKPVLKAENKDLINARITLVRAVKKVLKNGLNLLGIEAPEQM